MCGRTVQLAHLIGADPANISVAQLAVRLRERGITIVCTPVTITLDTGIEDSETEPASVEESDGQFLLPIPGPRLATKNPHQNHPANVNDFGGG
jgi:site-specific DNA recombinase